MGKSLSDKVADLRPHPLFVREKIVGLRQACNRPANAVLKSSSETLCRSV